MKGDALVIRQLHVPTLIGVFDYERKAPQTLRLDITLHVDTREAGLSDDLHHTLSYAEVAETVLAFGEASSFQLLEAFAEQLCQQLFDTYDLPAIGLVICKDGCIPGAQGAELHIQRQRSGSR